MVQRVRQCARKSAATTLRRNQERGAKRAAGPTPKFSALTGTENGREDRTARSAETARELPNLANTRYAPNMKMKLRGNTNSFRPNKRSPVRSYRRRGYSG